MFGRRKSRSIDQDLTNLSWSMLVKKPARSWLTNTRSASTGADFKMDNSVDISGCKVIGTGDRNELENQTGKDVEHGTEW